MKSLIVTISLALYSLIVFSQEAPKAGQLLTPSLYSCRILYTYNGDCKFNISDTSKYPIINKYKCVLRNLSDSLFKYLTFIEGEYENSKENTAAFNSRLRYTLIFSFNNQEKDINYCFPIFTDINGELLDSISFPNFSNKNIYLISKSEAITLSKDKWKNKDSAMNVEIEYDKNNKSFCWSLTRHVKYDKHGRYDLKQIIIIDAHTGKIINNTKFRMPIGVL